MNEIITQIETVEYLKNSTMGNPRIKVNLIINGRVYTGRTATDAPVGYALSVGRVYNNAKVRYHLTKSGALIVDGVKFYD